ncbi:MAG: hypothetical protein ACLP9L_29725 [Thermoguttaceae bacterium]
MPPQTYNNLLNSLDVTSGSMLDINGGTATLGGSTTNYGTLAVGSGGLFYNGGTVNVTSGASFTITTGSINSTGTFNVTNSALNVNSGTTLFNSGTINLATDAVFNNRGTVDNTGSVSRPSGCAVNNAVPGKAIKPLPEPS